MAPRASQFVREDPDQLDGRHGAGQGRALACPLGAESAFSLDSGGRGQGFAGVIGNRVVGDGQAPQLGVFQSCEFVGETARRTT